MTVLPSDLRHTSQLPIGSSSACPFSSKLSEDAFGYTNFEVISEKYNQSGYKMPQIVFWNLNGRIGNVPVTANKENFALISGFSPAILQSVLSMDTDSFSPEAIMNKTLSNPRYDSIRQSFSHFMD